MTAREHFWTIETGDRLEPFEAAWHALVTPENATPFQSFGLMRLFYRQVKDHRGETPVIALASHPDGRPAALFPMLRTRRRGLTWLNTDARPLDYAAPVFDPALSPQEARAIAGAVLKATGADLLYCNKMPAHFLGRPNPLIGLAESGRLRFSAWNMPLEGRSRDAIVAAQYKKMRKNLRRCAKRLAAEHGRGFRISLGEEISDSDFRDFLTLRAESFGEKGRNDILDDPHWRDFYMSLARSRHETCTPWLSRLEAGGETVAFLFGFMNGRDAVAIMPASKSGPWKIHAPGLQLFEETILHFHAMQARMLDLSVGDMPYKQRLGCEELALHDALFARGAAGRLHQLFWRLKVKLRERLRKNTRETEVESDLSAP